MSVRPALEATIKTLQTLGGLWRGTVPALFEQDPWAGAHVIRSIDRRASREQDPNELWLAFIGRHMEGRLTVELVLHINGGTGGENQTRRAHIPGPGGGHQSGAATLNIQLGRAGARVSDACPSRGDPYCTLNIPPAFTSDEYGMSGA